MIAYFTMEIGLEAGMPTYAGGLGILAGDTVRSAADLRLPMVAVSLLHRKGYFHQRIDGGGRQSEEPVEWVGVHAATWVSEPYHRLYERYIPGWRLDNFSLRYALSIPGEAISSSRKR